MNVIKGNIELLEAMADEDEKESFRDVMNAIQQIEGYIQEVIDINLDNKQDNTNMEEVSVTDFLCKLEAEVKSLGNNIIVEDWTHKEASLYIDVILLSRAINNIVLNGIERTPPHEKVQMIVKQDKDRIQFVIIDQGPGFSEEALQKGTELFYTENFGRTNNSHYGLGLT
ncbi:HAMP domain-containing histidine kinase, partial [Klebsiella pneumoniae]|nr:HAMP domain-containing histidine kinase [Klebsiella pneumoniae]